MNIVNNNSPISIIDSEKMMSVGYVEPTDFSFEIYRNFINSPYERKYYRGIDYNSPLHCWDWDNASFVLLKSYYKDTKGLEDYCLCSRVAEPYESERDKQNTKDYRYRQIGQQYGIVPTIPYKYVSEMTKRYTNRSKYLDISDIYFLGNYPGKEINFDVEYYFADNLPFNYEGLAPTKEEFNITEEKFSLPTIIGDKLKLETYNVYRATTQRGIEVKAIKYNDKWFRIDPVKWTKIGDDLVCMNILFESPVHIKNNYTKNSKIQSFDDTFLKWYIDNIFTQDLFKYNDCTFMKEQMIVGVNDDINLKMQEIERLKQIRKTLLEQKRQSNGFNQFSKEHNENELKKQR